MESSRTRVQAVYLDASLQHRRHGMYLSFSSCHVSQCGEKVVHLDISTFIQSPEVTHSRLVLTQVFNDNETPGFNGIVPSTNDERASNTSIKNAYTVGLSIITPAPG